MVKTLSETAVIPIAGMILTFVLCYELIQLIIEKNNMHDFDTFNIYKWIFKTFCAVYILTHTFDLVMGVFALAQQVVNASAGVISGSLDISAGAALADLETQLAAMGVWELIGLWLESFIIGLCLWALTICIFVIIFGRMIEIYLTVSVAPIPLATMAELTLNKVDNKTGELMGTVDCEIRVYPIAEPKGTTKGYASITVAGVFGAHGISIVEGQNGLFVFMPQTKDGHGKYRDIFHPIVKGGREALQDAILGEFAVALDAMVEQKESTVQKLRDAATVAKGQTAPAPAKDAKDKKKTEPEH